MHLSVKWLFVFFLLCQCGLLQAELVLTAPPRENPEKGKEVYGPLAKHLSTLLGKKVIYQHPRNWLQYQRDLRKDVYDIVFDGPHFVSWRMEHLKHDVLVKLPGTLEFVIVVNKKADNIKNIGDLIGKKVCGIPPPNLATLTVIEQFQNPVRQPVIWGVSGGYKQVYKSFRKGLCQAAVFRSTFYEKKLAATDREKSRVLFRSKALPNQAITVSSRLNSESKNRIIRSLTIGDGTSATKPISKRFGGKKALPFIAANKKEYKAHNDLLEGIVFGW